MESFNPLDGTRLGAVEAVAPGQVQAAVDDVAAVQPFWALLPLADRARYMRRAAQALIDRLDELAEMLSREQGKPLNESYTMELLPTIDSLRWLADAGPGILADERVPLPVFLKQKRARFTYEPLGVAGVLGHPSFPWSVPFGEAATALMAGNGVVLRPHPVAPLVGARIQEVFERAGLPEGLVHTVQGGDDVERALADSSAATPPARPSGPSSMVVCADANTANAIAGCLWGAFAGGGQSASSIARVFVVRELAEPFVEKVVAGAQDLRVGDPLSLDTEIGPMPSLEALERAKEAVDAALAAGATLHCGGADQPFFRPAVLTGALDTGLPGPALTIITVEDEDEAIARIRGAGPAASASVWTSSRAKGERIAGRLDVPQVWINDHLLGRNPSRHDLLARTRAKRLTWEPSKIRNPWWHPYDASLARATRASAKLLYGRDADKPEALRRGALPLLRVGRKSLRDVFRR